jgi:hypothetical protein
VPTSFYWHALKFSSAKTAQKKRLNQPLFLCHKPFGVDQTLL